MVEKELEELRERINKIVGIKDISLFDGEALRLSQELDLLIIESYRSKKNDK
jgi:hypothetical protein